MLFKPVVDVKTTPYCGPTVISALTGVPVSRIEKMIRRVRNDVRAKRGRDRDIRKLKVKGTYHWEVKQVLERLGCNVEDDKHLVKTFASFVDDTRYIKSAYLVCAGNHWLATYNGEFCDTSSIGGPRKIEDGCKYRLARLERVYKVRAPAEPKYSINDPIKAPPRERKPKQDVKEVRAVRLAAQVACWEAKERRAKTALKKLRPKLRRYQKLGVL